MGKASKIRLLVARAGSTAWDDAGRVQGGSDLPLSESGRAAVVVGLTSLKATSLDVILCGPDEASQETARLLAQTAKSGGAKVKIVPELAEVELGLWEGMLGEDLQERFPRACRQWQEDPASVNAPEGECLGAAAERVVRGLVEALERVKGPSGWRGTGEEPAVAAAVVLRPIALGIVRCWLNNVPTNRLWSEVKDKPWADWYDLTRDGLKRPAPGMGGVGGTAGTAVNGSNGGPNGVNGSHGS